MKKLRVAISESSLVHLVALLTAAMGVVDVLSAIRPSLKDRLRLLELYSPFGISTGGHLTSALAGFALLLLSVSLWRRKQIGWILTLVVLIVSIPAHLLKGLDYEEALLAALLGGLLVYLRPHYHARSDPPSVKQGLLVFLAALAFTLIYGVAGFYLLDRHFKAHFGFWAALRQTVVMFAEFYDPNLQPITGFGRYFADSIYIIGATTMGYALIILLRPVLNRRPPTQADRSRAEEIVRAHGHTSIARFTLFDDKLFFFPFNGAVISYVLENRIALTLGDPVCAPGMVSESITRFKSFCSQNDWVPVFYQVLPDHLEVYKAGGFDALLIGQEAAVDLTRFTLEGSENKTLRNTYNKLARLGFHSEVLQPPFSPRMLRELDFISNDWLVARQAREMRFSLGWFDQAYLNSCPVLVVRDREGFIEGFANVVSEYQANEAAVDLMRYRRQSESGLMDFLFISLFQWARDQGLASFNLGLSALTGVGEHSADPIVERGLNFIYQNVSRFYNFRGLHSFKEKFHPIWSPRYLIYPGASALPAIGAGLFRATFGGGIRSLVGR